MAGPPQRAAHPSALPQHIGESLLLVRGNTGLAEVEYKITSLRRATNVWAVFIFSLQTP